MKRFIVTTESLNRGLYHYFIEHPYKPTRTQLNEWLKTNGNDCDEGVCYERIESIIEINDSDFKTL